MKFWDYILWKKNEYLVNLKIYTSWPWPLLAEYVLGYLLSPDGLFNQDSAESVIEREISTHFYNSIYNKSNISEKYTVQNT